MKRSSGARVGKLYTIDCRNGQWHTLNEDPNEGISPFFFNLNFHSEFDE